MPESPIQESPAERTGYLEQSYRLFHLRDQVERDFSFHYHDFHKVVFFLEGNVTYHIEGKAYILHPGDLLIVSQFDIHKPVIDATIPYERFILWIRNELAEPDLTRCFQKSRDRRFHLMRLPEHQQETFRRLFSDLTRAQKSEEFGAEILRDSLLKQLMVYLNRAFLGKQYLVEDGMYHADPQIEDLLRYINTHLDQDLSVDTLARRSYLSRYYLMRKFREATGYTLHRYVTSKRLLRARTLLDSGEPVAKTAELCGFQDYTTFVRAYRKQFHEAPSRAAREAVRGFHFDAENRE